MKEKIRKFKEKHKFYQNQFNKVEILINEATNGENAESEAIRLTNLRFEKSYGEFYFDTFIKALVSEDIIAAEKKYKLKRINEHLLKIIEEYKQMTDELDAIIFADEEVGQNGTMSEM